MDEITRKEAIVAFYRKHNPENLHNIPEILRKFEGRDRALCIKLAKKYGDYPKIVDLSQRKPNMITPNTPSRCGSSGTSTSSDTNRGGAPEGMEDFNGDLHRKKLFVLQESSGGQLDFRSDDFHPQLALAQNSLPGLVDVNPLDNIHKCRILLPDSDHNSNRNVKLGVIQKKATVKEVDKKPRSYRNDYSGVLDKIAGNFTSGPFSLLHSCFTNKFRIVVVVRRVNSIRGFCTGYLKAFDKHMNLLLLDVTETFVSHQQFQQRMKSKEIDADFFNQNYVPLGIANRKSRNENLKKRYMKQILIRGDNVVLICKE